MIMEDFFKTEEKISTKGLRLFIMFLMIALLTTAVGVYFAFILKHSNTERLNDLTFSQTDKVLVEYDEKSYNERGQWKNKPLSDISSRRG